MQSLISKKQAITQLEEIQSEIENLRYSLLTSVSQEEKSIINMSLITIETFLTSFIKTVKQMEFNFSNENNIS